MAIRKRRWGDGKEGWEASVSFHGKKKRKLCKTMAEAKAWVFEEQRKIKGGTYLAQTVKATVASLLPQFKEFLEKRSEAGEIAPETARKYIANFQNYVIGSRTFTRQNSSTHEFNHGIGHYKVSDITEYTVEGFVRSLLAFGISKKTAREIKLALSAFFEFSRSERFVSHNPTRGVAVKNLRRKGKKKVQVPSKRLIAMMIQRAREPVATMIKLAMLSGVRLGEHRALTWGDIDFTRHRIAITKSLRPNNVLATPKTEAGIRSIPIASTLVDALKKMRQTAKFSGDGDPVFAGTSGKPICASAPGYHWAKLYEETIASWPKGQPVPPRPRWHDIRHFCASVWVSGGMELKAVQAFIGHETIDLTLRVYAHVFEDSDFKPEMDKFAENLLGSSRTQKRPRPKSRKR